MNSTSYVDGNHTTMPSNFSKVQLDIAFISSALFTFPMILRGTFDTTFQTEGTMYVGNLLSIHFLMSETVAGSSFVRAIIATT